MPTPPHRIDYRRHIASLDGLRGVAICLVFLHHYYPRQRFNPLSMVASAGWVGVDIFFVLSGFLITGILFETLAKPHSLRNFFARRSLRLFPLYFLVVGVIVLFSGRLHVPLGWADVLFFAYGANLSTAFGVVPHFGPYLRFNHLWSLAVEEQFYLLWAPFVFFLVSRKRILTACIGGIALAALLRGVGIFVLPSHTIYQSLFTRMDSILCGGLMAMGLRAARGDVWLTKARLYWTAGAGIAVVGTCFILTRSLFNEKLPTLAVGYLGNDLWCTALLGLALLPDTAVNRWTNHPTLRFIGRYSYGLYLLHEIPGPLFDSFLARFQRLFQPVWLSGSIATALLFGFFLLAAVLCFHIVEAPCLRLKRYFAYRERSEKPLLQQEESIDLRPSQLSL